MSQRLIHNQSFFVILVLVFILVFSLAQPAVAQGIIYGDTVPTGTEVDQNLILTGYDVTIDGTVNGDVMAFGTRVTVNGTINGTLVTAAEYININGQVTGNIYSAALLLTMGPSSNVARDLYFLGVQLNLQSGSVISRDLYTISLLSASFAGQIDRTTYAEIGPSAIFQFIFDLAGWPLPNWLGSGSLPPSWTAQRFAQAPFMIVSASPATFRGAGLHILSPATLSLGGWDAANLLQPALKIDPERLSDWGMDLLRNLVILVVVGLFMAWLIPSVLTGSSERLRTAPWPSVGWGLVVYLVGWFLFGLLFTLITALMIFLFTISFVNVGFLVGGVGLTSLGLAFALFCVSVFYASKIVAAFLFGRLLLRLVSKKAAASRVGPMLLGVILYALLVSVPYLGFVVSTITTFFGLGALWLAIRPVKQPPVASAPVEEALAEPAPVEDPAIVSTPEVEQLALETPAEEPPAVIAPMEEPPVPSSPAAEKPARKRKQAAN